MKIDRLISLSMLSGAQVMKKQTCFKCSLSKGTKRTEIIYPLASLLKQGQSLKASKLAEENHSLKLLRVVGVVRGNNGYCLSGKIDNSGCLWLLFSDSLV